jgi:hypothetical protein
MKSIIFLSIMLVIIAACSKNKPATKHSIKVIYSVAPEKSSPQTWELKCEVHTGKKDSYLHDFTKSQSTETYTATITEGDKYYYQLSDIPVGYVGTINIQVDNYVYNIASRRGEDVTLEGKY